MGLKPEGADSSNLIHIKTDTRENIRDLKTQYNIEFTQCTINKKQGISIIWSTYTPQHRLMYIYRVMDE